MVQGCVLLSLNDGEGEILLSQGLMHYQQNLDCQPAYYTISYNNEDPGTQVTPKSTKDVALHSLHQCMTATFRT